MLTKNVSMASGVLNLFRGLRSGAAGSRWSISGPLESTSGGGEGLADDGTGGRRAEHAEVIRTLGGVRRRAAERGRPPSPRLSLDVDVDLDISRNCSATRRLFLDMDFESIAPDKSRR